MTRRTDVPWLKIEHTPDGYRVHWRIQRQHGRNTLVDLGHSRSFATKSEAQHWHAVFAKALAEDEPIAPP